MLYFLPSTTNGSDGGATVVPALLDHPPGKTAPPLLLPSPLSHLIRLLSGTSLFAIVGGSSSFVIPIVHIISDASLQQISDHRVGIERELPMRLFSRDLFKQCWLSGSFDFSVNLKYIIHPGLPRFLVSSLQ
ncbi:hypothetical protein M5689_016758 [Euphorbia peplus]|nr:hypothetical protein M5689_016758 [Euphorbia peplus]